MAKPRLDENGQLTEIFYERGTKPLSPRVYRAPADRSDVPTDRKRGESWKPPRPGAKELPKGMIVKERQVSAHTPPELEDKKRLECPFPLVFRPIEQADYNFVLNAWMRSYRDAMRVMKNDAYFQGQQNLIAELAKRRQLVIGCDGDTPAWIAGFACGVQLEDGRMIVDYLYVKHAYRDRGIARGLLSALGWTQGQEIIATHKCRALEGCFIRYNASFNPFFNMIGFSDV
jgi:GNAT superfamily N-acetyltransferase